MRLISMVVGLTAASLVSAAAAQQASPSPPPRVGVAQARALRMAPKVTLPGTVVARSDSRLASEVEGRVAWVAEVGTVVKAGDVVARIDRNVAGMQLASDKANVARLSAQLRFDRSQADRMNRLYDQSAIAKATRDQAQSTREMDEGALAQAQASMRKSEYQFNHSEVRAPFPGRVVARLINPGEYAAPGKEIVRLVDIDSIEVKAQSPIDSARFLREGMPVDVEVAHRPLTAAVRAIVPVGDEASRTIEIRVALKAGQAFVGDAAKVFVPAAAPRQVLAVPRDALVLREDNTYLFKVDGKNVATRVAVETGTSDGSMVEVHGPVKPGERVIVRGAERLEAGQKVQPILAS
ncbi:MAG: efflux RND transporter periplasmic adaptor subunit [Alphaproteobacteria bacterium]|nr:efflux RND transporter periplasmic adaptor subunit [Alphaproteobacteria bacterium]MBV9063973.1 efflux RND transporter periplasmic adaptor subunit [Alphaproteobacteria bacterium]